MDGVSCATLFSTSSSSVKPLLISPSPQHRPKALNSHQFKSLQYSEYIISSGTIGCVDALFYVSFSEQMDPSKLRDTLSRTDIERICADEIT